MGDDLRNSLSGLSYPGASLILYHIYTYTRTHVYKDHVWLPCARPTVCGYSSSGIAFPRPHRGLHRKVHRRARLLRTLYTLKKLDAGLGNSRGVDVNLPTEGRPRLVCNNNTMCTCAEPSARTIYPWSNTCALAHSIAFPHVSLSRVYYFFELFSVTSRTNGTNDVTIRFCVMQRQLFRSRGG